METADIQGIGVIDFVEFEPLRNKATELLEKERDVFNIDVANKMKRYQIRRWDKRNTLRARKYAVPFLFLMWLTTLGMAYAMTL